MRSFDANVINELKSNYADKPFLLVGNGPSLASGDLELARRRGFFAYGVNKIFLMFEVSNWRPEIYSVSDHAIKDQVLTNDCINIVDHAVLPRSMIPLNAKAESNDKVLLVDHISRNEPQYRRIFSRRADLCTYGGYTVLFFALQVLFSVDVQTVLMVGVDHDYSKAKTIPTPETSINGRLIRHQAGSNHFHENYFNPGDIVGDVYLDEIELSFQMARDVYEADGRKLLNASRKTNLNSIERVRFEDVIG